MARILSFGLFLAAAVVTAACIFGMSGGAREQPRGSDKKVVRVANRPRVPGKLLLHLRERREEPKRSGKVKVVERTTRLKAAETAIIVCDMWDDHHCKMAAHRVGVMAPRMNQVLSAARDRGVMISHARGTDVVVEHIERYLCPSIASVDLTKTVPGSDGPQ